MKQILLAVVLVCLVAVTAAAQTVTYTGPAIATVPTATVQAWKPALLVNTTTFALVQTCTTTGTAPNQITTCTAPLPAIGAALTATGNQTFSVSWTDPVLGAGPQSSPLVLVRPFAPGLTSIQ